MQIWFNICGLIKLTYLLLSAFSHRSSWTSCSALDKWIWTLAASSVQAVINHENRYSNSVAIVDSLRRFEGNSNSNSFGGLNELVVNWIGNEFNHNWIEVGQKLVSVWLIHLMEFYSFIWIKKCSTLNAILNEIGWSLMSFPSKSVENWKYFCKLKSIGLKCN